MKICFLTDDPTDLGGGPEHIKQVQSVFEEKYHQKIAVITPKTFNPNFNFNDFNQRIKFALWVLNFLLSSNYDIYHSHTFSTSFFLPLVRLRGKKAGITVHGKGIDLIGGGILNTLGIPKLLSSLLLNYWPFNFRFSASHINGFITVGNGVNLKEFDYEKSQPNPKYFTILCVARRDPVKGIDILENALKEVQKKYPNVKLNLVSGTKRSAKDFKTADLYVLPSLSEGFPLVLLEAMAAKLPIIATNVGDCKDLVTKAQAGQIINPGDVAAITSSIIKMIQESKTERKSQGENGYNFVKDKYSWEKVAQKYYDTYQKILH